MVKYLLTDKMNFYKANLHCHTTDSDGQDTPKEMKEAHKAHGYSILAYSDHDMVVPHPDLKDDEFLPLTAGEYGVSKKRDDGPFTYHTCHFNIISSVEKVAEKPAWINREYSSESISGMMKKARDEGYFVIYNHPVWSCENSDIYLNYHGMHAFEIMNYGSMSSGWNEYNDAIYDDMLRHGKRIFAVAGDDNHNHFGYETKKAVPDWAGTYTVINAEKLEYDCVMDALFEGNFYASEGPSIYELRYEDNKVYVRTSECRSIFCCNVGRKRGIAHMGPEREPVTEAEFELMENQVYFRLTLIGMDGKRAYTNAYFLDDLKAESEKKDN
jgi:hypothetical protein